MLRPARGSKVALTPEIEATVPDGFSDAAIGVVRDYARSTQTTKLTIRRTD